MKIHLVYQCSNCGRTHTVDDLSGCSQAHEPDVRLVDVAAYALVHRYNSVHICSDDTVGVSTLICAQKDQP